MEGRLGAPWFAIFRNVGPNVQRPPNHQPHHSFSAVFGRNEAF
jgi:hypothetical protein